MSKLERVESTIIRALTEIFFKEVKDQSIGFITFTAVRLTNDYSYLTIFYTILGQDPKKEAAKKALERVKPFVRSKLAQKVKMRKVPQLIFKYDESLNTGNRIEKGLKEVLHKDE